MRPKDRAHGDWASNAAMQRAKKAGMKPRDLAELFAAELTNADGIKSVEVAGPGFINITPVPHPRPQWWTPCSKPAATTARTTTWQDPELELHPPTRPARSTSAAPVGRPTATPWPACLRPTAPRWCANTTNDHGEQINRFAKSLVAAAHDEETPIDGYKGAYIDEIAKRVIDEANADGVDVLEPAARRRRRRPGRQPARRSDSEQRVRSSASAPCR